MERRESYYKVRFRDLEGHKQTILIGRELFTKPSKVVAELLKANADLPDEPKAVVKLVKQLWRPEASELVALPSAPAGMIRRLSILERRSALLPES